MKVVLAKVHYDAAPATKERIEHYIRDMRGALGDPEVAHDVEQRMVDILEEHGIQAGQNITAAALDKVEAIMGDPSDFTEIDMQQMMVYHKRLSALQLLLRFSGAGLLLAALSVLILLVSAIASFAGRDAANTFPSGGLEWTYAIAGIAMMTIFMVLSTVAGISLLQGRLTPRGRRLLRSVGIAGLGTVVVVLLSAVCIAISN